MGNMDNERFDLNLTNDQKNYILARVLQEDFQKNLPGEIKLVEEVRRDGTISDASTRMVLQRMAADARYMRRFDDVLQRLGGWPIDEDDPKWRIPNLYVVGEPANCYYDMDDVHEEAGTDIPVQIYHLYLMDEHFRQHYCSAQAMVELHEIAPVLIPEKDDLSEEERSELRDLEDEVMLGYPTGDVGYTSADVVGGDTHVVCRHLGAPQYALFDQDGDPREIYEDYMRDMAGILGAEGAIQYDLDVVERLEEDVRGD